MTSRGELRYRVLGPLAVERDGAELDLGTPKQRAVLAVLLHDAGQFVSVDRLVDRVWGDRPPSSVQASLHANISRLRRLLRDDASAPPPIMLRGRGYRLDAGPESIDAAQFTAQGQQAQAAVQQQDWPTAVRVGRDALALWRGAYLEDFQDEEWTQAAAGPLTERRAGVLQAVIIGLLGTGDVSSALAESTSLLSEQPLVERAAWLHMVALNRAGRAAEALNTYRRFAAQLDAELGLDPGPGLRDLQAAILRNAPELLYWPAAAPTEHQGQAVVPSVIEPADRTVPPPPVAPTQPAATEQFPLIGRQHEMAIARAAADQALAGAARWTVLTGPPGIGKTRLAQELMAEWVARGGMVSRGQCPDLDQVPAWWPIRQVLRDLGADPDVVLTPVTGGDVDAIRFAAFERAADVVRQALAGQPVMIVIDDIHWADRSSVTLLTLLAESLATPGLLVLMTSRPTRGRNDLDRLLAAVTRRSGSVQIELAPLPVAAVAQLVEHVTGDRPTGDQAAELARRTGGTPFYVVEFSRSAAADPGYHAVPVAVRTVLRRRFAALPADVLAVVSAAAVLGEPLEAALIAAPSGRDVATVTELLDAAADLDLLMPSPDGATYLFVHALLRDELAAHLPEGRRQVLHLKAAELLAGRTAFPDVVRRARHLLAAGPAADPEAAYQSFRAAAAAAERQLFYDTAAIWWQAALHASDHRSADSRERDDVVAALVRAMAWAGRAQGVLDVLGAALIDALRDGRTDSVGRLAANLLRVSGSWPWPTYGSDPAPLMSTLRGLDGLLRRDPGARSRVLAVTAIGECYHPDPQVPDRLSRRAIELAEQTGDQDVLADALLGRALTYAGVATHSQESIEVLNRLADLDHELAPDDEVLVHNLLTMATINLGLTHQCAEHVHAGAVGADVLRRPIDRVQLRWAEASLAQWNGDLRRARELYDRAELAHRRTDLQQAGTFELAELVMLWDQGRLGEANGTVATNPMISVWLTVVVDAAAGRDGCDAALAAEIARPEPDVWTSHGRYALLAHCVADRGLVDLAAPLIQALHPIREQLASFGQVGTVGPIALALARLARLTGDTTAARRYLDDAHDICARSDGRGAALHCQLEDLGWQATDVPGPPPPETRTRIAALARQADARGMRGVADRARQLYQA